MPIWYNDLMVKNKYKILSLLILVLILVFGRGILFSSASETEPDFAGGPGLEQKTLHEIKKDIKQIHDEQSMLYLTKEILRDQLQSLSTEIERTATLDKNIMQRILEGKKQLGIILLREQETQHHLTQIYRSYLRMGGEPIAFLSQQDFAGLQPSEGKKMFLWPTQPKKGLSAYFLDQRYRRFFGINHYAIDIPNKQGSNIYAPADGIVTDVNDAGYGYSTLKIDHGSGYETLYGHVLNFFVEEGQKVYRGDIIALSGGKRSTPGAGNITTGAHLHFEIIYNGERKNPLDYLPPMEIARNGEGLAQMQLDL